MGAVIDRDGAGPMVAPRTHDLARDDVQRLVPTDPLIAGDATILRITFAIGIEIHAFQGVKNAVIGIANGFQR